MGMLYCCVCCCCFNNLLSKTLEIMEIVYNSTSLVFLLLCLIIIKWSNLSIVNLLLFLLLFIIILIILILTIFLRYWRAKGTIKTTKKAKGLKFATACFVLSIICLIINIIEEFVIIFGFNKADYPCYNSKYNDYDNYGPYYRVYKQELNNTKINNSIYLRNLNNDIDCYKYGNNYYTHTISNGEYYISYFTFSYLEIILFLSIWIYYILRKRIIQELDGPIPTAGNRPMQDQYGRQVVVVQPGDVVIMDGQPHVAMPMGYQNNNQNNNQYNNQFNNQYNNQYNNQFNNQFNNISNLPQSQNISNIGNSNYPNSQDISVQEKLH